MRADEERWDREDGTTAWVRWEVRPWLNVDGEPGGILILAEEITRRKSADEALAGMSRKLIEAHERERTWIGRELHDDINQRLAILAVQLDKWSTETPVNGNFSEHFSHAQRQVADIAKDVQALSHRLHSSKLDYLGLASAAKSFCRELSN